MKKMFKLFMLATFSCTAALFAGCNNPEPGPEPIPDTDPVNEFRFDGASTPIRSLVVDHLVKQDVYTILLSPDAGLATYEDATAKNNATYKHPFFLLEIPASSAVSFRVDMLNPGSKVFRFENNARVATDVSAIAPGSTGTLKSGEMSVVSDGKKMTVRFKLTLSDDRVLDGHYEGAYTLPTTPERPASYLEFDGKYAELKSVIVDDRLATGLAYILMSPVEGLTTFEEFAAQNDKGMYLNEFCIFTLKTKNIADVDIDAMAAGDVAYSFINQMQTATEISQVGDQMTALISAGHIRSKISGGKLNLDVLFTAKESGKKMVLRATCAYEPAPTPTSNFTVLDGETLAVKSAFYELRDYGTELFLTPSQISKPDYLEDVNTYYISIFLDNYAIDGKEKDVTTLEDNFQITLTIPKTGEVYKAAYGDLNGAEGIFSMAKKDTEGEYALEFDLLIGGHEVSGTYDGAFVKKEKLNGYSLNGEALVALQSAVMDKSDADLWKLYLSTTPGVTTVAGMMAANPVILQANPTYFDGVISGFTTDESVAVIFDGKTYNGAANKAGNLSVLLSGDTVTATFTLYKFEDDDIALEGYYKGNFTAIP